MTSKQRRAATVLQTGHFFTAVVDCDHVLFVYTQNFVRSCSGGFKGYLGATSATFMTSSIADHLRTRKRASLCRVICSLLSYLFQAAICKYAVGAQGLKRIRAIYAATMLSESSRLSAD